MQYEIALRPQGVLQMPPVFNPASQWVDMKYQNVVPYVPNVMGNLANALGSILPNAMAEKKAMNELGTNTKANEIAQNYLNQVLKKQSGAVIQVNPQGPTIAPFTTRALISAGMANMKAGGDPNIPDQSGAGTVVATGDDNNPTPDQTSPQPPAQTPPSIPSTQAQPQTKTQTPGQKAASDIGGGKVLGEGDDQTSIPVYNPAATTAIISQVGQPLTASSDLSSGVRSTDTPAPDNTPTGISAPVASSGQDIFDKYKANVAGNNAVGWRGEVGPDGKLTGRIIVQHKKDSNGVPILADQPIHPEWAAQNLGTISKAANPYVAGMTPGSLQPPTIQPSPDLSVSAQPAPDQSAIAQTPIQQSVIPTDPSQIAAMGTPLEASSAQQSGVRSTDTAPRATAVRTPVNPPSFGSAKDPNTWRNWVGSTAEDFGTRANNPDLVKGSGTDDLSPSTPKGESLGVYSKWRDIKGDDGQIHRLYIDPTVDGGRPTLASQYIASGRVSDFSEHRSYLNGQEKDIHNAPLEAYEQANALLVQKWGTMPPGLPPGSTYFDLSRQGQEAAVKRALLREHTTPLDGQDLGHLESVWQVMQLADKLQPIADSMPPQEHDQVAVDSAAAANAIGSRVPGPVKGFIKTVTGGGIDLDNTNNKLRQMRELHSQLVQATRSLTSSTRYNEKGEQHLDTEIGNPTDRDYASRLNDFRQNFVYPDAGRIADIAYSNHKALPQDFADYQAKVSLGTANSPPGQPGENAHNPMIIHNQEEFNKLPKDKVVYVQGTNGDLSTYQIMNGKNLGKANP